MLALIQPDLTVFTETERKVFLGFVREMREIYQYSLQISPWVDPSIHLRTEINVRSVEALDVSG